MECSSLPSARKAVTRASSSPDCSKSKSLERVRLWLLLWVVEAAAATRSGQRYGGRPSPPPWPASQEMMILEENTLKLNSGSRPRFQGRCCEIVVDSAVGQHHTFVPCAPILPNEFVALVDSRKQRRISCGSSHGFGQLDVVCPHVSEPPRTTLAIPEAEGCPGSKLCRIYDDVELGNVAYP